MKKLLLALTLLFVACNSQETVDRGSPDFSASEVARWKQRAEDVTIIRDNWGIPHIYGKTDADTVFGLLYAQAEDDFNRVELNYINGMGRLAEAEGEAEIYRDLRMKLFIDPEDLKHQYENSAEWLKKLMDGFADGLNYFLYTHPQVVPKVITRFEPWMALSFSEGSIGTDIEQISVEELESFYGGRPEREVRTASGASDGEPRGSNGFAIAPSNSATGHALLYINPHTSFFFRDEVHMVSEEGLNAYGAATWGQFFVYQGFNERVGWMHTSSRADTIDEYLESVIEKDDGRLYYLYGDEERPLVTKSIAVPYRNGSSMAHKEFTAYYTHHGPIIREEEGKWVSIRLMQEPVKAITQSYLRTKAAGHEDFHSTMELLTNSSNNTVYADADGNIAYYHGNFIPRRDPQFDWTRPVDGSNPATDWQGLHPVDEAITLLNPPNGWIQNTNNWPFSAAGPYSPKQSDYPAYMSNDTENFRGIRAVRVLENKKDFTLDSLIAAGYDSYLTGFEYLLPSLFEAYGQIPADDELKNELSEPIETLRQWDLRFSETSTETSLAVYWGDELMERVRDDWREADAGSNRGSIYDFMAKGTTPRQRLEALSAASKRLQNDFGSWQTPWGEINRYQRLTGDIVQPFNDDEPSVPVGFASGRWGSLASFGARTYPGTKRMYGTSGNSFVAAVEFGDRVRAKAVTAGGLSSDPESVHFNDQEKMYCQGRFRDVLFYREDIEKHIEREYRPGQ